MSVSTSGFALRNNGTCAANEVDCGETAAPFHACCTASAFCPSQYNVACCPSTSNCTATLVTKPSCANSSWDLYDNQGYFCCQPGLTGYAKFAEFADGSQSLTDGCASAGYAFEPGDVLLSLVSKGLVPTSTVPTTASTSPPATSPPASPTQPVAPNQPPPEGSGPGAGTIAGAVVGSVAAVVLVAVALWFFLKKRRASRTPGASGQSDGDKKEGVAEMDDTRVRNELDASHGDSELHGTTPGAKDRVGNMQDPYELAG